MRKQLNYWIVRATMYQSARNAMLMLVEKKTAIDLAVKKQLAAMLISKCWKRNLKKNHPEHQVRMKRRLK